MTPTGDPGILLASVSPRRRRLLEMLGVPYECVSVGVPEDVTGAHPDPAALAAGLATQKALAAAEEFGRDRPIVTADTIVVHENSVLGKPADVEEAVRMLESLSGRTHVVITAVALLTPGANGPLVETVTSEVRMRELDRNAIARWVAARELLGCAGAYNIENHLARVDAGQCYQNVAGLPLCHLYRMLAASPDGRIPPGLCPPVTACDAVRDTRCDLGARLLEGAQPR